MFKKYCVRFLFFVFLVYSEALPIFAQQQPAEAKPPLVFGALHVFTGEFSHLAKRCRNGLELAKDDINQEGGILGRSLQIIYEDWGPFDPVKAVSATHKLITIDKISALLPAFAEDTQAVATIAERSHVPLMATSTGGVNIRQFGANVFRATNGDEAMIEAFMKHLVEHKISQVCLVRANTAYFENVARALPAFESKYGVQIKDFQSSIELSDSKAIAARIKREPCDEIIALTGNTTFVPFLRDLRRLGCNKPVLGPVYIDLPEVEREESSVIGELYLARYQLPEGPFTERYQKRFGEPPYRPAGNCYDAARVLGKVMSDVGTDWSAVNAALHSFSGYRGVTGNFEIAKNNDRFGEITELVKVSAKKAADRK